MKGQWHGILIEMRKNTVDMKRGMADSGTGNIKWQGEDRVEKKVWGHITLKTF